jgi:malonyl CoA-acyl carrier protein transacylase/phosphopantetheinyl transferase (holo-ACP synthase)
MNAFSPFPQIAITAVRLSAGAQADTPGVWRAILHGHSLKLTGVATDPIASVGALLDDGGNHPVEVIFATADSDPEAELRPDLAQDLGSKNGRAATVWGFGGGADLAGPLLEFAIGRLRTGAAQVIVAGARFDHDVVLRLSTYEAAAAFGHPLLALLERDADDPAPLVVAEAAALAAGSIGQGVPSPWLWTPEHCLADLRPLNGLFALAVAVLALHDRLLPAAPGATPAFRRAAAPLPWLQAPSAGRRRATVLLQAPASPWRFVLSESDDEQRQRFHPWPMEPFLLAAQDRATLLARIVELLAESERGLPLSVLASSAFSADGPCRLGFLATCVPQLQDKLRLATEVILGNNHLPSGRREPPIRLSPAALGNPAAPANGAVVVMFPGIGAAYPGMLRTHAIHFPVVANMLGEGCGAQTAQDDLTARLFAAPDAEHWQSLDWRSAAGVIANIALHALIESLGVVPDTLLGFSNGENTALVISEAVQFRNRAHWADFIWEMALRGSQGVERGEVPTGQSWAVTLNDRGVLDQVLAQHAGRVFVSIDACPRQVVLFGLEPEIGSAIAGLRQAGVLCMPLDFERAFHTPLYERELDSVRQILAETGLAAPSRRIWSCATNAVYPVSADGIRDTIAMAMSRTVRFWESLETLYDEGSRVFIEAGPRNQLAGYARDTLTAGAAVVASLDREGEDGLEQVLAAVTALHVAGRTIRPEALFSGRAGTPLVRECAAAPAKPGRADGPAASQASSCNAGQAVLDLAVRDMFVSRYFALMQDFVHTQERVVRTLLETAPRHVPAPAPRRPFPALTGPIVPIEGGVRIFAAVDPDRDAHLDHHRLGRTPPADAARPERPLAVMAMVMSLEYLAEAACALMQRESGNAPPLLAVENIAGSRWLPLRERASLALDATLQSVPASGQYLVHTRLRLVRDAAADSFDDIVSAQVRFGREPAPEPLALEGPPRQSGWDIAGFNRFCLFHGSSYVTMEQATAISADGVELVCVAPPVAGLFEGQGEPALRTPANLLDVAGQAAAFWLVTQGLKFFMSFPVGIRRYRCLDAAPAPGQRFRVRLKSRRNGSDVVGSADLLYEDSRPFGRLDDMRCTILCLSEGLLNRLYWRENGGRITLPGPLSSEAVPVRICPPGLIKDLGQAGGILGTALAAVVLTAAEQAQWHALTAFSPRQREFLLGRIAAKEAAISWLRRHHGVNADLLDIAISADALGRPSLAWQATVAQKHLPALPAVSIAHCADQVVAAVAGPDCGIGIDVESVLSRAGNGIEAAFEASELALLAGHSLRYWWAAKEAAAKAAGTGLKGRPQDWRASPADGGAIVVHCGTRFAVAMTQHDNWAFALCVKPALADANGTNLTNPAIHGGEITC